MDELRKPEEDIAKSELKIIEEANVEIKAIIVEGVKNGVPKEELEKKLKDTIKIYSEQLEGNEEIQKQIGRAHV